MILFEKYCNLSPVKGLFYIERVCGMQRTQHEQVEETLAKYADMVYKIAFSQTKNKCDAEDVFQEVFLRYVKNSHKLAGDEHTKAWLIRVALNCCKSLFITKMRKPTAELDENIPIAEVQQEDGVLSEVLALPSKYRIVIHLFYYEDYSIEQISGILGRKVSTVKSHLFRGRQLLKERLQEEYDF